MQKLKSNRLISYSRSFPIWMLLLLSGFFLLVSAFSLRSNNQNMIKLRDAVFIADEQNADVEESLRSLREYVYSHMNTDLAAGDNAIRPPIQLKYRYERLVQAELATRGGGSDIYNDAQSYCEQNQPSGFSGRNRLDCVRQYIDQHGGSEQVADINIPDALYKFDFVSPGWSPDLAGISLLLGCAFLLAFVLRLAVELGVFLNVRN